MSNIRPTTFNEIIGQSEVIHRLSVCVDACNKSAGVMPHVLIDGPPGLGKTTIASAIASEMGVNLYVANAANLRNIKNVIPYLMRLESKCVFFIDEIHRLSKIVEEFLYPVMEDYKLSFIIDKEPETIDLPQFTLVGATTSGGSLSQPFYDRFTIKEHLTFYNEDDLAKLAGLNAKKFGLLLSDSELLEIAKRSKGTPRILNARLQWYRNFVVSQNQTLSVDEIFNIQGIDNNGLDVYDRMYIDVLANSKGSPLGLKTISSITGISIETIENSIEPFLVRKGFVTRTSKGRILSKKP
jgi:holliday junction DNA helicase RuvB